MLTRRILHGLSMHDPLDQAIEDLDGVGRRRDFARYGVADREIAAAVAEGRLIRVRHGTYASRSVDPRVLRAVRVGGVLAGPSAAAKLGLWSPPSPLLTVSVMPHAVRLRDPGNPRRLLTPSRRDVRIRYDRDRLDPVRERLIVGVERCIIQCLDDLAPRLALAVLDSAFRLEPASRPSVRSIARELPRRCHPVVEACDARADSGTESVLRWHLLDTGVPFEFQKWLTSTMRVDFMIDGFLVVECQSYEFHSSPDDYENDRRRIAAIIRLGHPVVEVTYHQVLFDWPSVEATIAAGRAKRWGWA